MLNNLSRSWFAAAWFATVFVAVGLSGAAGSTISTMSILLVVGIVPVLIMMRIFGARATPTVAEILHSGDGKSDR